VLGCSCSCSLDNPSAPTTCTITLTSFLPNQTYNLRVNRTVVASFTTDSSGDATYEYAIPSDQQAIFAAVANDAGLTLSTDPPQGWLVGIVNIDLVQIGYGL
jgi:hypothetical protein